MTDLKKQLWVLKQGNISSCSVRLIVLGTRYTKTTPDKPGIYIACSEKDYHEFYANPDKELWAWLWGEDYAPSTLETLGWTSDCE